MPARYVRPGLLKTSDHSRSADAGRLYGSESRDYALGTACADLGDFAGSAEHVEQTRLSEVCDLLPAFGEGRVPDDLNERLRLDDSRRV